MLVDAIADPWTPEEVQIDASWVHVAPLSRSDFPAETLAALARGRRVSFDGQGLVRPARTGLLEPDGAPTTRRFSASCSILKLADDEAALLVDGYDERSLARLGVPESSSRSDRAVASSTTMGSPSRPLSARRGPRPDRRG